MVRLEHAHFTLNSFTISACEKPKPSSFSNSSLLATASSLSHPLQIARFFQFPSALSLNTDLTPKAQISKSANPKRHRKTNETTITL
jgi:hypothetical protein